MSNEDALLPNIQTCVLKGNIDCDGCKKMVRKRLQRIEGVYEVQIESEDGKVTVTGKFDPSTLVKRLNQRIGRSQVQFYVEGEVVDSNYVISSNSYIVEPQVPVEGEVVNSNSVISSDSYIVDTQVPVEGEVEETTASTSTSAELKEATKFSYFATALAGGGILGLLGVHLENKSGLPPSFKALTFFVLATFVSALSIILLTICAPSASYQILIIRGLVYTTLVFLALTVVGVSIVLMKGMGELALIPAIVVVIIACIIVYYKKKERSGQQQQWRSE